MKKKTILLSSTVLLFCDFLLKYLVKTFLLSPVTIIPNFFYLHYVENDGAAWGIFSGNTMLLIFISFVFLFFLLREIFQNNVNRLVGISYTFILAGLIGNLIDRIFYGYVVDYLQVILIGYSFPIFNLADIVIVVGIFLLMFQFIRGDQYGV